MPFENKPRPDNSVKIAYISGVFLLVSVLITGVFGLWSGVFANDNSSGNPSPTRISSPPTGTTPQPPSQTPNLNGRWDGFVTMSHSMGTASGAAALQINQNGSSFTGEMYLTCPGCWNGLTASYVDAWIRISISGSVDSNGMIDYRQHSILESFPNNFWMTCNGVLPLDYIDVLDAIIGSYSCNGISQVSINVER